MVWNFFSTSDIYGFRKVPSECNILFCISAKSIITNTLNIAYNLSDSVILCGDFSFDLKQKCQDTDVLFDGFESFELNITTSDHTRIFTNTHGHTSFSAIDYMVTNLQKRKTSRSCSWTWPTANTYSIINRIRQSPTAIFPSNSLI